ncbi:MAG: phage tail protein [Phaeodactylibacter sp.]|nr:phage tail protein [Phaeodactylibacter sp.]
MEPIIGQIMMFAGNFAPRGWAFCEGQLLQIAQYTALFSLIGTSYGGDGRTTFGLPDFRGRVPNSQGQTPGGNNFPLGHKGGVTDVTLSLLEMPQHNHTGQSRIQGKFTFLASPNAGTTNDPTNGYLSATTSNMYIDKATATAEMGSVPVDFNTNLNLSTAGGSQPHTNMQPYLPLNFVIALQGIYPNRP